MTTVRDVRDRANHVLIVIADDLGDVVRLIESISIIGVERKLLALVAFARINGYNKWIHPININSIGNINIINCINNTDLINYTALTLSNIAVRANIGISTDILVYDYSIEHPTANIALALKLAECLTQKGIKVSMLVMYRDEFEEYIHALQRLAEISKRIRVPNDLRLTLLTSRGLTPHIKYVNEAIGQLSQKFNIDYITAFEPSVSIYESMIPFPSGKRLWVEACIPNSVSAFLDLMNNISSLYNLIEKKYYIHNNFIISNNVIIKKISHTAGDYSIISGWMIPCTRIRPSSMFQRSRALIILGKPIKSKEAKSNDYIFIRLIEIKYDSNNNKFSLKTYPSQSNRNNIPVCNPVCNLCPLIHSDNIITNSLKVEKDFIEYKATIAACITEVASNKPSPLLEILFNIVGKGSSMEESTEKGINKCIKLAYLYLSACSPPRNYCKLSGRLHVIAAFDIVDCNKYINKEQSLNIAFIRAREKTEFKNIIESIERYINNRKKKFFVKYVQKENDTCIGVYAGPAPCDNEYCIIGLHAMLMRHQWRPISESRAGSQTTFKVILTLDDTCLTRPFLCEHYLARSLLDKLGIRHKGNAVHYLLVLLENALTSVRMANSVISSVARFLKEIENHCCLTMKFIPKEGKNKEKEEELCNIDYDKSGAYYTDKLSFFIGNLAMYLSIKKSKREEDLAYQYIASRLLPRLYMRLRALISGSEPRYISEQQLGRSIKDALTETFGELAPLMW